MVRSSHHAWQGEGKSREPVGLPETEFLPPQRQERRNALFISRYIHLGTLIPAGIPAPESPTIPRRLIRRANNDACVGRELPCPTEGKEPGHKPLRRRVLIPAQVEVGCVGRRQPTGREGIAGKMMTWGNFQRGRGLLRSLPYGARSAGAATAQRGSSLRQQRFWEREWCPSSNSER